AELARTVVAGFKPRGLPDLYLPLNGIHRHASMLRSARYSERSPQPSPRLQSATGFARTMPPFQLVAPERKHGQLGKFVIGRFNSAKRLSFIFSVCTLSPSNRAAFV